MIEDIKNFNDKLKSLNTKLDNSNLKNNKTIWMIYITMTFILAVLKLMGYISITWLWVFSPIWLPPVIIIGIFLSALGFILSVSVLFAIIGVIALSSNILWEKFKGRRRLRKLKK